MHGVPPKLCTLVDNEPRSLGVVTNIDYLVNEPRVFMYKDIKAVDLEDKKPEGEKEPLPILDHSTNLKIRPWDSKDVSSEFQTIMSISPYRERGIALWSTMWESVESLKEAKEYKNKLYEERFGDTLNVTVAQMEAHPGFYIDEAPCNEEKYDCTKLAECRGINIKTKVEEETEEEVDPCAEYETEIQTIFIDQEHSDIEVLPKHSYRIRIREEAFATDAARIHWRISSRPPARYDTSRACLEQGIVQLKGGDLLLTSLTSRDVRRRIQGTLADGRKINIQLRNAG
ncbi:hypothetical protein OESDEN_12658 [Oesophagostomum dentatum]|uniref:Uncharacterized protein n=1 Tax=Oesophagostomum dentatum TaxID=61180 RepID=A0A0B1SUK2_OESDE|nr:hypothetical protein OESDEN_12658 [Oesophagostomum dentatum]